MVVRRYIDFLILLIPTPLVSVFFAAVSLLFVHFVKCFSFLYIFVSMGSPFGPAWAPVNAQRANVRPAE